MNSLEKEFDKFADKLEKSSIKSGYMPHKIILPELRKLLGKGSKILDLGVGTGLSSRSLIKSGFDIVGIDFSKKLLEKAAKYNYKKLVKQDIKKKWKVKNCCFDAVVCFGVLDFFKDLTKVFKEAKRVLKNKGFFTFTVIKSQKPKSKSTFRHTKKEIRALAKNNQFIIIKELEFEAYKKENYSANYYGFILKIKK